MNDEQPTSGTSVNPAPTDAPRQGAAVMDVVPPPAQPSSPTSDTGETTVVAAPPEDVSVPQMSDDIADQIAADATLPPAPEPGQAAASDVPEPAMSTPPVDGEQKAPGTGDSPSDLIESEIQREADAPVPVEQPKAPKASNPATAAVVATVFLMVVLAGLAVFAYTMTNKS
jgi:hypothetical protein